MIYIERLRLINYKVFEDKIINLQEGLNVFSGPNGYGKTSLFDAIELLITGNIKRIQQNELIDGRNTYDEHYIARNIEKNVIIQGEFVKYNQSKIESRFTIVKILPSGKSNNPKNLVETTQTYILDKFDDDISSATCLDEHPSDFLCNLLGDSTQTALYKTLYYIEQENRLSYFKQSEKNRVGAIRSLFGMTEEIQQLEKLDIAVKKINAVGKKLQARRKELEKELSITRINAEKEPVEYFTLLNDSHIWDTRDVIIPTKEILEGYIGELIAIKTLLLNKENFIADKINHQCDSLLYDDIGISFYIQKAIINLKSEEYLKWKVLYEYFESLQDLVEKKLYSEIDFLKLDKTLNKEAAKANKLIISIKYFEQQLSGTQKTLSEIIDIRNQLQQKYNNSNQFMPINQCIYCGYDWSNDANSLEERFSSVTNLLNEQTNSSSNQLISAKEDLSKLFIADYLPVINENIEALNANRLFVEFRNNQQKIDEVHNRLSGMIKNIGLEFSPSLIEAGKDIVLYNIQKLKEALILKKKELSPEYYSNKQAYNFDQVARTYFSTSSDLDKLDIASVDKKISYINYRYYAYHEEKKNELDNIKHLQQYLNGDIKNGIKKYRDKYESCLAEYQQSVIAGIEIPFYIYSSRLLQSYPGGQGILIKAGKAAKLEDGIDSIRFVVPNKTHDVLYTMSSGQLSGVLLSFTLALYKTFTEQKFSTLLIDDPVQSMDDVNVVSLVELLKSEFGNTQILISTHEEIFAKYSTYKYSKARLSSQIVRLKDEL